jgi:hypothetical protein
MHGLFLHLLVIVRLPESSAASPRPCPIRSRIALIRSRSLNLVTHRPDLPSLVTLQALPRAPSLTTLQSAFPLSQPV